MRKLDIGNYHRFTTVNAADEPSFGGACHEYLILGLKEDPVIGHLKFGEVKFQKGPVIENGVNGCFMEDLIAINIDRLRAFQAGDFACVENAAALWHLETALSMLNGRTADRIARGVEGKNEV